jgi:60 kDa SS-A/Ro ribonucleoprotein
MARINVKEKAPAIFTHEGGPAKHIDTTQQLRRLVLPCLLWEDSFYVDGKTISEQIGDAVKASPASVAAAVAIEAREKFHLRHVPLLVVREMARLHPGTSIVGDTLARVIQRPDEIGEFCAIYWKDAGNSKRAFGKGQPLSAQVKKGLAHALGKFDQYQLAKYAKGGAVRLRDVMFLTQPKPALDMEATWKQLADDDIGAAEAVSKLGDSTGTWESDLSQAEAGADKAQEKAQVWTVKLRSGTLGYLALLRNLRNMVEAGVDLDVVREAIVARKGAGRVLPFRYVAAARAVPQLEPEIDRALCACIAEMRPLPGKTVVLVDVSGSMDARMSRTSDLNRIDAAATLASIVPGDVRVFTFSNQTVEVPPRRGLAGVDAIKRSQPHAGTMLGQAVTRINGLGGVERLIVITDEQSHDRVPEPAAMWAYMINVAAYKNGVGYGRWTHVDGFSEAVLAFIAEFERTESSGHHSED